MSLLRKIPFLYRRAKYRGEGKQGGKGGKVARFAAKPEPSRRLARYREGSRQPAAHRSATGSSARPAASSPAYAAPRARRPFVPTRCARDHVGGEALAMAAASAAQRLRRQIGHGAVDLGAVPALGAADRPALGEGQHHAQDIDCRGAGVTRAFDLYQAKLSFPYASTSTREIETYSAHTFQTAITGARIVSQPLYRPKLPGRLGGIVSLVCPCQV